MGEVSIERRGGFAGLRARATLDDAQLDPADRKALESLFTRRGRLPASPGADRYRYIVTWTGPSGTRTLEVPEHLMPQRIAAAVKDELP